MRDDLVLRRQLAIVRARGPVVLIAVVVAMLAAYVGSGFLPRVYEARATLLVGQALAPNAPDFDQLLASQRLSQTYASMATMRSIVLKVLDRLELTEPPGELEEHVIAQTASDSLFLTITAQNADPATAAEIANAFADELVLASPDVLLTPDQPGGANLLQVVDPAVAPLHSRLPGTKNCRHL
jgi:capsular polysaccharide biosynthesis protein